MDEPSGRLRTDRVRGARTRAVAWRNGEWNVRVGARVTAPECSDREWRCPGTLEGANGAVWLASQIALIANIRMGDDRRLQQRRMFRRDVREELAEHALVGMHRRAVGTRVILDVVALDLLRTDQHEVRFAQHGQRRRGHLNDRKHGKNSAAQADEQGHGRNVRVPGV